MTISTMIPNIPHTVLLEQLSNKVDITKFLEDSIKFYSVNSRHRYSELSKYINKKSINDQSCFIYMLMNLDMILEYIDGNKEHIEELIEKTLQNTTYQIDYDKLKLNIKKLQDHIELEETRLITIVEREKAVSKRMITELNKGILDAQKNLDNKTSDLEGRMNNSFITILGIFSAIILAFFGGLNGLSNTFNFLNNNKVSSLKIVVVACLIGIILFNVIFMLLYIIGKISSKNIGSTCPYVYIIKSRETKNIFKKIYFKLRIVSKRFPIFFGFNFLLLAVMAIDILIYFVKFILI